MIHEPHDMQPAPSQTVSRPVGNAAGRRVTSALKALVAIDTRSLAAFRIGLALVMLCDLASRAPDIEAHYSDAGVLPRSVLLDAYLAGQPWICLHILHGSAYFIGVMFCISAVCALALLVGYRTRLFTIACWFLTFSLDARNPFILHGGDELFRILLFWGMFLPLHAHWSVDRLRNSSSKPIPDRIVTCATAALILQVFLLYVTTGILKTGAPWRKDGTAVFLALSIDAFTTPIGKMLLPHHDLLTVLTFGTLVMEIIGPFFALFSGWYGPLRTLVVLAFFGFHFSLSLCMHLGIFPWACMTAWIPFLPACFWDDMDRIRRKIPALTTPRSFPPRVQALLDGVHLRPVRIKTSWEVNLISVFYLVYIALWNVRGWDYAHNERFFPAKLDWIGALVHVDQNWSMFAPYPPYEHGWYVSDARLKDGSHVDILTGKSVSWVKPPLVCDTYIDDRWRKYMMNLLEIKNAGYRFYYGRYITNKWNERHKPDQRVVQLDLYVSQETTQADYRMSPPVHIKMFSQSYP